MPDRGVRLFLYFLCLSLPSCLHAQTAPATDIELRKGQEQYGAGDIAGALSTFRQIAYPGRMIRMFFFRSPKPSETQVLGRSRKAPSNSDTALPTTPGWGSTSDATYRPNIALSLNNLAIIYSREKRFEPGALRRFATRTVVGELFLIPGPAYMRPRNSPSSM